jgi:hypothetical protein
METTMKSPIVATTDPRPFDPCEDIPFDAVQRLGLAFTPPEHEDGLRCHFDAGNYQIAVEAIIWRTYAQTLPPDALETTIQGHRAADWVRSRLICNFCPLLHGGVQGRYGVITRCTLDDYSN